MTTFRLIEEFGPVLTGRTLGERLRQRVEDAAAAEREVVLDFEGIELIAPSFADEAFGKMPPGLNGHVRRENVRDDVEQLIQFVISRRAAATGS